MKRLFILLAAILILTSCSFRNEEEKHEKLERPSIILENAEFTLGQDNNQPVYIKSSVMMLYSEDHKAIVENMSFISYDENMTPSIEGSADYAEIDTEAETMALSGNVRMYQHEENMTIESDALSFDTANDEITAAGEVYASSDDGSFRGSGFAADLREKRYSFRTISEGVFNI